MYGPKLSSPPVARTLDGGSVRHVGQWLARRYRGQVPGVRLCGCCIVQIPDGAATGSPCVIVRSDGSKKTLCSGVRDSPQRVSPCRCAPARAVQFASFEMVVVPIAGR